MKHTYQITGMSCNGCRTKVKTLNAIEGVEASVSLEDATATITMEKHVPTATMQEALNLAGIMLLKCKPTSDSDKSVEDPVTKSCCGSKDRQHNNETHQHVKIIIYQTQQENTTAPCIAREIKYMTKQAIVLFAEWIW
jgi:Cu2+-exporting ATPase